MTDAVTPFRLETGTDQLEDLRQRLAGARWPEPAPVTDWSQGVPVDWLRDLCAYWQDGYDWRRCEKTLSGLPQFTTELDGLGVRREQLVATHDRDGGDILRPAGRTLADG